MAEWRVRRYVPDSDEEEDSQESVQVGEPAPEKAKHSSEIKDGAEGPLASGFPGLSSDRGSTSKHAEQRPPAERAKAVEVRINNDRSVYGQRNSKCQDQPKDDAKFDVKDDCEIDELQEEYYREQPLGSLHGRRLDEGAAQRKKSQDRDLALCELGKETNHGLSTAAEALQAYSSLQGLQDLSESPRVRSAVSTASDMQQSNMPSSSSVEPVTSPKSMPPLSTVSSPRSIVQAEPSDHNKDNYAGPQEPLDCLDITNNNDLYTSHVQAGPEKRPGRSFRQRKAIQLHPYVIEGEKYRKFLNERGVKAVRITQAQSQAQLEDESQVQDFQGSQHSGFSSSAEPESPGSSPPLYASESGAVDEDFPDMDVLLRHQSAHFTQHGHKRRRLYRPKFKRPPGMPRPPGDGQNGESQSYAELHQNSDDFYEIPPSPPLSGGLTPSTSKSAQRRTFRRPIEVSPNPLPTPATSSEPRAPHNVNLSDRRDPEEFDGPTMQDTESDSSSAPSVQEVDPLRRVKKKIRGVLPASWLKLDLRTHNDRADKSRQPSASASPEKRDYHKGIARPLPRLGIGTTDRASHRQDPFVVSDDETSKDEGGGISMTISRDIDIVNIDDDDVDTVLASRWGEADEGEEIDAMLPGVNRSFQRRRHKKRQTRMSDFGVQSLSAVQRKWKPPKESKSHRESFTATVAPKCPRPKFRPPKMSVLDALPCSPFTNSRTVPPFLKIASRTARGRQDRGRHSPSRKFLRLATREDTLDANQSLHDWRAGSIAPKPMPYETAIPARQPLMPLSGNTILPPKALKCTVGKAAGTRHHTVSRSKPCRFRTTVDHHVHTENQRYSPNLPKVQTPIDAAPPTRVDKGGGKLMTSLRKNDSSRPAMLEILQEEEDQSHPRAAFSRQLFGRDFTSRRVLNSEPLWDRFLGSNNHPQPLVGIPRDEPRLESGPVSTKTPPVARVRPRRKRRPRHLDTSMNWQEDIDLRPVLSERRIASTQREEVNTLRQVRDEQVPELHGLGPFGTRYTSTFDIVPFPQGTCFHQSTFIGSGDFNRSLHLQHYDFDRSRGSASFTLDQKAFHWGPWNEGVSSEMGALCERLVHVAEDQPSAEDLHQVAEMSRQIIEYCSDHLHFLDPIDRIPFLQKCKGLVKDMNLSCVRRSNSCETQRTDVDRKSMRVLARARTLSVVFANQLRQLSQHHLVPDVVKQDIMSTLSQSFSLLKETILLLLDDIKTLVTHSVRTSEDELCIRGNEALQAFVIAQHISEGDLTLHTGFLDSLQASCATLFEDHVDVDGLEQLWKTVFTLQACLEFDNRGVLETGRRFKIAPDNWTTVNRLLRPVLEIYLSNMHGQAPSFNAYCRALFSRCLHLINSWGWRRCDSIIGTLFDFFARSSLNHLSHEESHGSPGFLEHLSNSLTLAPEPEDRCFHLLLKIIGSGIRHMRLLYPEKKIRDLVWRLMPNHGRSHPKEEAIRQEDLDALRNHHDLLCTLYWASAPGFRPRLSVMRDLVHVQSSHKEACHVNIRTWSNLVNYQLLTVEPMDNLEPFREWNDSLIEQILQQHVLARTEAEEQVTSIHNVQGLLVSQQTLEMTISNNQRQIESMISDALACLHRAIQLAQTRDAADTLFSTKVTAVFSIFDLARPQTNGPIIEALNLLLTYTRRLPQWTSAAIISTDNEDSQEYGDWTAFGEGNLDTLSHSLPLQQAHDHLRQLLSNCFGADASPADDLLAKMVDSWAAIGQALVKAGMKSWSDYIGSYGSDTWSSLRNTDQTRKYTTYYLAILVENDSTIFSRHKDFFLRFWIESLMERESLLKFQHKLTSALLNSEPDERLFSNLPFWTSAGRRFDITPREFSERRLSLISCLLSNMRISIEHEQWEHPMDAIQRKQEYKELLRHLMATMKHNYQELGQASNVRGAYVDFVHCIVGFLQQYTTNICPIDRFFTDNASFPLPAKDPTYVIGQLKNYALGLQDPRAPKELAIFLQSVSERAAVDGQQSYLSDQLCTAICNTFEDGAPRPTLRTFMVKAILPAYTQMALQSPCGWILALPFLLALMRCYEDLLRDLDGCHAGSVQAVSEIAAAYLRAIRASLVDVSSQPLLLERPSTLVTIRTYYETTIALLPTLDYLARLDGPVEEAVKDVLVLDNFASNLTLTLDSNNDASDLTTLQRFDAVPQAQQYADVRRFALDELRQALDKNWICIDGSYFVSRGSSRREVLVDVGLYEEERRDLKNTMHIFHYKLKGLPSFGGDEGLELQRRSVVGGLEDLVL